MIMNKNIFIFAILAGNFEMENTDKKLKLITCKVKVLKGMSEQTYFSLGIQPGSVKGTQPAHQ